MTCQERPCVKVHPDLRPTSCEVCRRAAECGEFQELWCLPVTAPPCNGRHGQSAIPVPTLGYGPGTELKLLLAEAGLKAGNCSCNSRAAEMDRWGAGGCRERREEIVGWLQEEYEKLGWLARLGAGLRAVKGGLVFDVLEPVGGLVDEAIRRAEEKAGGPQPPAG